MVSSFPLTHDQSKRPPLAPTTSSFPLSSASTTPSTPMVTIPITAQQASPTIDDSSSRAQRASSDGVLPSPMSSSPTTTVNKQLPPPPPSTSKAEAGLPKVPKRLPSLPRSSSEMITPSHSNSLYDTQPPTAISRQNTEVFSRPKIGEGLLSISTIIPSITDSSYYEISIYVSNFDASNKFLVCMD